jgi:hypothetical protein
MLADVREPSEVLTPAGLGAALADRARQKPGPAAGPRILAVDGWSGSGKTSLAERMAIGLGAPCVHLDDWVPGWSGLARSVDLLVEWVLAPLADGRPAGWRRWDWDTGHFGAWEVLPAADLVVVEGSGAGSAPARPWLSGLVWITIDEGERQRRLHARPDWGTYAPWAGMWAGQERAQRAGEDPCATADAVVETGPDSAGPVRVHWADR